MDFKASFIQELHRQQHIDFTASALALFKYQAQENSLYKKYLTYLNINIEQVTSLRQIPFLPIEFFKSNTVTTGTFDPEITFYSSGTTQTERSRHLVSHVDWYTYNTKLLFEQFYGSLQEYVVLALLPSYLEQGGSSLVKMVEYFIKETRQEEEGFYLHDHQGLLKAVHTAKGKGKKVLLIGVSYALLDWADELQGQEDFNNVIVMETGGMKGRRKEMVREELHAYLKRGFGVDTIHSEYGMTELLSQAYSQGNGIFSTGYTMHVLLRDLNDPLSIDPELRSGGINIIDLANVDSCAFIETKDIGRMRADGGFEVLGRFDNSDIRGCNLLVS
ncbi:acyl transferase [Pontibacter harenae]|uniref:acyl transferase n=1 Tax=Pontibacter harenae TaxID=2894083 RepID=UPI001E3F37E1|nr:acyl transferase [Pontibacter harenae]MCC9167947.1 acyl transferase [Pontibacter harenae]